MKEICTSHQLSLESLITSKRLVKNPHCRATISECVNSTLENVRTMVRINGREYF